MRYLAAGRPVGRSEFTAVGVRDQHHDRRGTRDIPPGSACLPAGKPGSADEAIAVLEQRQASLEAVNDAQLVASNADALFSDGYSFVGGNPEATW